MINKADPLGALIGGLFGALSLFGVWHMLTLDPEAVAALAGFAFAMAAVVRYLITQRAEDKAAMDDALSDVDMAEIAEIVKGRGKDA